MTSMSLSAETTKPSVRSLSWMRYLSSFPRTCLDDVVATCAYTRAIDCSSRAGYRSILVLTSLANTCAGQSKRRSPPAPIIDDWVVITPKRPVVNSIHTTPPLYIVQKTVFSLIHFLPSLIHLWPSCHSDLGIETWLSAVPRTPNTFNDILPLCMKTKCLIGRWVGTPVLYLHHFPHLSNVMPKCLFHGWILNNLKDISFSTALSMISVIGLL